MDGVLRVQKIHRTPQKLVIRLQGENWKFGNTIIPVGEIQMKSLSKWLVFRMGW
jgi:hypothetical protein